jgi:hypothetical protein
MFWEVDLFEIALNCWEFINIFSLNFYLSLKLKGIFNYNFGLIYGLNIEFLFKLSWINNELFNWEFPTLLFEFYVDVLNSN